MDHQQTTLHYFKKILVSISKPETALQMLTLAQTLVDPQEGKVIAFTVSADETGEQTSARLEELKPIVEQFDHVELVTHVAGSITRGILDATREQGADALMIGMQRTSGREVKLGTIVENIIQTAPCDVLIYRASLSPGYDHIVVPIDNNRLMPRSLRIATLIASRQNVPITPAIIQRDYTYTREKNDLIQSTLSNIPEELVQKRQYIQGSMPAESLLNRLDEDDLLVLGFSQRDDIDLEIGRNLSRVLLRRASGPLLLCSQILEERSTMTGKLQRFVQYWNPTITQAERNELIWGAQKSARTGLDYSMLILMSAALASFGLLLNSPAVIIGAMLVAPLMTPLGALAVGLASGELGISRNAVLTLIQGVLLALLISMMLGVFLQIETPTQEMLGRGMPSLLDAAVALASGLVAAFALARKEIPAALAGVAIAAALMPPVCTIGLGLAMGNLQLAGGASLLFLANITSIVFAQSMIFLWVGMRPGRHIETNRGIAIWYMLLLSMLVVITALIVQLGNSAQERDQIQSYLENQLPEAQFLSLQTETGVDSRLLIRATVRTTGTLDSRRVSELETGVSAFMGFPIDLEVVTLQIIQPADSVELTIHSYFSEMLPESRIQSLTLREEPDGLVAEIILLTAQPIEPIMISQAEQTLSEQLTRSLDIQLAILPIIPEISASTQASDGE